MENKYFFKRIHKPWLQVVLSELNVFIHLFFPQLLLSDFFFSLKLCSQLYLSGTVSISKHCLESLICVLAHIRLYFRRVSQEHNKEAGMRFVQWYLFRNMVRHSHTDREEAAQPFHPFRHMQIQGRSNQVCELWFHPLWMFVLITNGI